MNFAKVLRHGRFISLIVIALLTPVTYWPLKSWLNIPAYDLGFAVLVSFFLLGIIFPQLRVPRFAGKDGVLLLFFLWLGINGLTIGSYGTALQLLQMLILLYILVHSDFSSEQLELLALALVLGGSIVGLVGIYQHLYEPWNHLIPATLGNANLVSGLLSVLIPISFSFWLHKKISYRIFGVITTSVLAMAMTVTYTRAGWLTAIGAMAGFALMKNKKLLLVVLLYVVVLGVGVQGAGARFEQLSQAKGFINVTQQQSVSASKQMSVNSVNSRVSLWRFALQEFRQAPITGIGIGNYRSALAKYIQANPGTAKNFQFGIEDVHNAYLDFLAELGLPGLILFLGVIGFWVAPLAVHVLRDRSSTLQVGLMWGLVAYLLHNITNVLLLCVPTSYDFWAALGILTLLCTRTDQGGFIDEFNRLAQ